MVRAESSAEERVKWRSREEPFRVCAVAVTFIIDLYEGPLAFYYALRNGSWNVLGFGKLAWESLQHPCTHNTPAPVSGTPAVATCSCSSKCSCVHRIVHASSATLSRVLS